MRCFSLPNQGISLRHIPAACHRPETPGVADVRSLRGVRFDRRYSGPVGRLIAPPYDVIGGEIGSNTHGIGLIENVEVGNVSDQHALAAARYRNWRTRGV